MELVSIAVDNRWIKEKYAKMMSQLKDLKIHEDSEGINQPLRFIFKGGIGIVMPLRMEEK